MMSEHAYAAADRRDALAWCIEGLEWFLSLSAWDHVANASVFTYYAPLLSAWRSSPGTVKVGRELVPLPPAGEFVCETLLMGPNAALGMELQKRFDELERAVLSWRDECRDFVEQWRWDNDHLGDLPGNLYVIFGEPPVAILDGESAFRNQARALLRLLEACRSLDAFSVADSVPTSPLTPQDRRLLDLMMRYNKRVTFNELRPAWQREVQESAIVKALKRLKKRLPRSEWDFEISEANWEVIWCKKGQAVP